VVRPASFFVDYATRRLDRARRFDAAHAGKSPQVSFKGEDSNEKTAGRETRQDNRTTRLHVRSNAKRRLRTASCLASKLPMPAIRFELLKDEDAFAIAKTPGPILRPSPGLKLY